MPEPEPPEPEPPEPEPPEPEPPEPEPPELEPPEPEPVEPSSGPGWIEYTQNLEEPVEIHLSGYPTEEPEGPSSGQCIDPFSGAKSRSASGASEPNPFTGNPSSSNPYSEYLSPGPSTSSNPPTTQWLNPEWTVVLSGNRETGYHASYIPPEKISFSESEAEPVVAQPHTPDEKQVPPTEVEPIVPQSFPPDEKQVPPISSDSKTVQQQDEKSPEQVSIPPLPVSPPEQSYNGPRIGPISEQTLSQEWFNRFITLDLNPWDINFGWNLKANPWNVDPGFRAAYAMLAGIKHDILAIKEWISPTPQYFLGTSGKIEAGPMEHTDALMALASLAVFAIEPAAGARRTLLMVGPETEEEFSWLVSQAQAGWEVTAVNPLRTPAATAFEGAGYRFVQGGVEKLDETFSWVYERMPQPLGVMDDALNAYQARLNAVGQGGRLTLLSDNEELTVMYEQWFTGPKSPFTFSKSPFTPAHPEAASLPPAPATSKYVDPGAPLWLLDLLRGR